MDVKTKEMLQAIIAGMDGLEKRLNENIKEEIRGVKSSSKTMSPSALIPYSMATSWLMKSNGNLKEKLSSWKNAWKLWKQKPVNRRQLKC